MLNTRRRTTRPLVVPKPADAPPNPVTDDQVLSTPREPRTLKILSAVINPLQHFVEALLVVGLLGIVGFTAAAVFDREVFSHQPPWLEDMAQVLFVWVVVLGAAVAAHKGSLPTMHVFERLPRIKAVLEPVSSVAIVVFFLLLAKYGWTITQRNWTTTIGASGIPMGYIYLAVPVGSVAALVFMADRLARQRWNLLNGAICLAVIALTVWLFYEHKGGIETIRSSYTAWFMVAVMILLVVCSVPVAVSMGLAAMLAILSGQDFELTIVPQRLTDTLNSFVLLAVPLFLLVGHIMMATSLGRRLTRFAKALVGPIWGGAAMADLAASAVFADMSGSAVADTAAIGSIMKSELLAEGYEPSHAAGMQAAAGTLGILYPPSVTMIIYAWVAQISVKDMFLAIIVPGVVVTLLFAMVVAAQSRARGIALDGHWSLREIAGSFKGGAITLAAPVIILWSIFSGFLTPSESGMLAVLYTAVAGGVVYHEFGPRRMWSAFVAAGTATGQVALIIGGASGIAWVFTSSGVPDAVGNALTSIKSPTLLLTMTALILILIHTVMEATATILVIVPVMLPVLVQAGINPFRFGVVIDLTTAIGLVLPPIGFCLFMSATVFEVQPTEATRHVLPYVGAMLIVTAVVLLVPSFTTYLGSG